MAVCWPCQGSPSHEVGRRGQLSLAALLRGGMLLGISQGFGAAAAAVAYDWRYVDPNLPLEPHLLHPSKRFAHRDSLNQSIQLAGLPLGRGSELPRVFEAGAADGAGIDYEEHSRGRFCSSGGPPWLADDLFEDVLECMHRCTRAPICGYFTAYESGWCQLSIRCDQEATAGDPSAVTYAKVKRHGGCTRALPEEGCLGKWAAGMGKPLAPRRWAAEADEE
mmetsp:Transcript_87424/g.276184  ORF Transcript_87424/g.276184 Transcript_87424/m.276184 type:complete len:221 (+) Transcript_87424:72-734(+)